MAADVTFLRETELLRHCDDRQFADIMSRSREITLASGQLLFAEADLAHAVWILLEGDLVLSKVIDGEEVIIDRVAPGTHLGEISLLTLTTAHHRARAEMPARLLEIPGDAFRELVRSCDAVMETVLRTLAQRVRRGEQLLQQRERMAALGTLAAGLAHELNNPAAAVSRAAKLLEEEFTALEPLASRFAEHPWSQEEVELLRGLKQATGTVDPEARELDPVARSVREEALSAWLEAHHVERAWDIGPVLVERGLSPEQLEQLTEGCDVTIVVEALTWIERMATIRQLLEEVNHGAARMSELVRAVKAFYYADTKSLRTADLHEGLESSLTILSHKLKHANAKVVREYDRTLPPLESYGTQLNQVWTNLIDNAADAVAPKGGTIRVRTHRDDAYVTVEIVDSGSGISPEVRSKIFEPSFTTKAAGKGTGLGLEIVKRIVMRHRGTVNVTSVPGDTRFTVRLPVTQGTSPAQEHAGRVDQKGSAA